MEHAVPRLLGGDRLRSAGDYSRLAGGALWQRPDRQGDHGVAPTATFLPEFFIGYLLIFFFAVKLQWLPSISMVYESMPFFGKLKAIVLPATVLVLAVLAHMMRITRAATST